MKLDVLKRIDGFFFPRLLDVTMFWSLGSKMIAVENVVGMEMRVSWKNPLTPKITVNGVRMLIGF